MMKELCEQFSIKHHNSTPYRLKMNGAVETANKNMKKIIEKMAVTYKDWSEKLPYALYDYRTSVWTSTGETPFSLVYGIEVVLPVEVEITSLRIAIEVGLEERDWINARYEQLNLIEERKMEMLCRGQLYQRRMMRAYDKKVRPQSIEEGDLVLKRIFPPHKDHRGKWTPNCEGPYVVHRKPERAVYLNKDGKYPLLRHQHCSKNRKWLVIEESSWDSSVSGQIRFFVMVMLSSTRANGCSQDWGSAISLLRFHFSGLQEIFDILIVCFPSLF
ncbi:uncharacterized protein LOC119992757 [Tripterygium wilfordii]|uniref:uncharacterized protein LOC119992757 n=1 Tax=Tripterygium wilfordii TaxID=458696 RepID=UPI0018F81147|nr:uncharacterized protein LOC119992757 [Tripterygium wilfordii]